MSAHFTHRRRQDPTSTPGPPHLTRPHLTSTTHPTSALEITLLLFAVLLMAGLVLFLIWSCLYSFEWFRNMLDPQARMRYNAERIERAGLWASREGGAFTRALAQGSERQLLCDRSAYLGGGRGYGWRTRGYGDAASDVDKDRSYGSLVAAAGRRESDASGRSVRHRDDCDGQCGITERKSSRHDQAGV